MKRQFMLFITIMAAFLLSIAATGTAADSGVSLKKFTIRIALSGRDQYEPYIEAFRRMYPHAKVDVIDIPWGIEAGRELREHQLLMLSSGEPLDIGAMVWGKEFFRAGLIDDLTAEIAKWPEYRELTPGMLERMTYQGRIYGATIYPCAVILHYNKDILARVGVKDPPKTSAELMAICRKIKSANLKTVRGGKPIYGLDFEGGNWHTDCWFWINGGKQMSDDYQKTLIDSPASIAAFTWMQDMVKNGYAPKPDGTYDRLWLNGQVAFFAIGTWEGTSSHNAGLNFGAATLPKGPTGVNYASMGGTELTIFKGSKLKTEALDFIRLFYRKDLQLKALRTSVVPGRILMSLPSLYNDPDFMNYWKSNHTLDYFMVERDQLKATKYNFLETPFVFPEAVKIYTTALERLLVNLEDPAKIMKEAAAEINRGIAEKLK